MASKEVDDFQEIILENAIKISRESLPEYPPNKDINEILMWIADQDISTLLGDIGGNLRNFCRDVDATHPYLYEMFTRDSVNLDRLKLLQQVIKASPYFANGELDILADVIRSQFSKYREISKDFSRHLVKPPVRLLKDATDRNNARKAKKPSIILLSSTLYNLPYEVPPDSFKSYFCGYNYRDEIREQEEIKKVFSDINVTAFISKVNRRIDEIKSFAAEQYYGFIRVKMVDAAIIMAKSMGFHWPMGNKCIHVMKSQIPTNCTFWKDAIYDHLNYQTHKYPLYAFNADIPDRANKIINLVEKYPPVGGKPIFDHFWVVCPSFHLDQREFTIKNKWLLKLNGSDVTFDISPLKDGEIGDASVALDLFLLKKGFFTPVILGERDGQCFFLCYWR